MIFSEKHNIYFADEKHLSFYEEQSAMLTKDVYHRVLAYTLGICHDTRRNFRSIYSLESQCIISGAAKEAWQTSGSLKCTRLAFSLFTDLPSSAYTWSEPKKDFEEDFDECRRYSVSDIFSCEFAPYFIEAIKLRYPESFRHMGERGGMKWAQRQ